MARMPPPYFGQALASNTVSSSSSQQPAKWSRYLLTAATTYCAAWGLYYLAQDSLRRSTVRRRRKRHHRKIKGASGVDEPRGDGESSMVVTQQSLSSEECAAIEERFASTSILGRYVNPFPEWREQGVWEFIVWKGLYFATHFRFNADGGIKKSSQERIMSRLQTTQPNWAKHRGPNTKKRGVNNGNKGAAAGSGSEPDSWDELSESELRASKAGPQRSLKPSQSDLAYTWIGQSTFLLTLSSHLTVLTDPVFGVQPIPSLFSPTRLNTTLPATLEEILSHTHIDVVVVSHNHFDHFDARVVPLLGEDTKWVVPKGMGRLLLACAVKAPRENIFELDWWQEVKIPTGGDGEDKKSDIVLQARALPAMHWTARTGLDTNQSLWCSYSLELRSATTSLSPHLFFSGDTGYSPSLYRSIGAHSGPFDVAFLPIGSYSPRWHMRPQHVSPEDSVEIAKDIRAKKAVGMHWGTWIMSDEQWEEPVQRLEGLVRGSKWFETTGLGETRVWRTQ